MKRLGDREGVDRARSKGQGFGFPAHGQRPRRGVGKKRSHGFDRLNGNDRGPRIHQHAGEFARSGGQVYHPAAGTDPQLVDQPRHSLVRIAGAGFLIKLGRGTKTGQGDTMNGHEPIIAGTGKHREPAKMSP